MLLGKRPASLRLSLPHEDQSASKKLATGQNGAIGTTDVINVIEIPNKPKPKRLHLSNFQTSGCLSPTDSPQILANSLQLAKESEGKADKYDDHRIGPYLLLSPLDSSGVSHHVLDTRTRKLKICQVLNSNDRSHLYRISERLNSATKMEWSLTDLEEMKTRILPKGVEVLRSEFGEKKEFLFSPPHFGSLHSFVQGRKKLDENSAKLFYAQIVRIVAFCHSIGIVVRDLKLRKFVFADEAQTQLRLAGVSDLVVLGDPQDDELRDRHGCPAYVSPEVLNLSLKSYSGQAADVWSLGVLLFVMLLGRYPFYDPTPTGLFGKIRMGQFLISPNEGLSLEVRYLLRGLLRRDPKERPSALSLLSAPWLRDLERKEPELVPLAIQEQRKRIGGAGPTDDDQLVPFLPEDRVQDVKKGHHQPTVVNS